MLIHSRIENSSANGPGNRAVIWTAGCTLNCQECWNPDTHPFDTSKDISVFRLVEWVVGLPIIEGVTFSGGEPFQQAAELALFCQVLRQERPDLSIGAYTGYTLRALQGDAFQQYDKKTGRMTYGSYWDARVCREHMDFLVAGRFDRRRKCDDKPLCGSSNQQVHFLTGRYHAQDLQPNMIEMIIDLEQDLVQITGFPSDVQTLTLE